MQDLPLSLPFCLARQSLALNLELTKLVGQQSLRIHLSQPSALTQAPLTSTVLTWVLDDRAQLSVLMRQAIYQLNHLPTWQSAFTETYCVSGAQQWSVVVQSDSYHLVISKTVNNFREN